MTGSPSQARTAWACLNLCAALCLAAAAAGQPRDPRVVVRPAVRDVDANKIDDALEVKVATGTLIGPAPGSGVALRLDLQMAPVETGRQPYADLLVSLDHPPGAADAQRVTDLGGRVVRAWSDLVFCMNARLPAAAVGAGGLPALAALPQVTWVEENHRVHLNLFYSTRQTRSRSCWTRTTPVDGDPTIRLAVCDTGLDGTQIGSAHTDLNGKIAGWYDAYAVSHSETPSASAIDENGHGSHVAGIVAG